MATVFRPPVVTRIPLRDASAAIQAQAGVTGINILVHTNPVPFHQTNWPVPPGPRQGSIELRTFLNALELLLLPLPPRRQSDWPVPPGRLPGVVTNRTWVDVGGININLHKNPYPFRLTDWPVTAGARRSIELLTWLWWKSPPPIVVGPAPFFQTDWPNPRGPLFPLENRTFLNPLEILLLPLPPIRQFDWPVPLRPEWPRFLRDYNRSVNLGLLPLPTIRQYDWPVPRGAASMVWRIMVDHNLLTTTLVPPAASTGYDFWHYYSP